MSGPARTLLLAIAIASCVPAGPPAPEPGVGLPADPTTVRDSAPRAPADTARVRVAPPLPETREPPTVLPPITGRSAGGRMIRVLLGVAPDGAVFEANGSWQALRRGERPVVATGVAGRTWRIEGNGRELRVVRSDGAATAFRRGVIELRPASSNGRFTYRSVEYRGMLVFHPADNGVLVVNELPLEDYLGGVVPREIGPRTLNEIAAVEAQAVAARTYAVGHLKPGTPWDVRATTDDQVYGGASAENAIANRAIDNTRGLVLRYRGRIASAFYHSTCGGSTAEVREVWHSGGEPYLQRVSDRIPGTDRDYCDPSPRHRWTKTISADALDAAVARHLATYQKVPGGGPGGVRRVNVAARTSSGRVETTEIETVTGTYAVRRNDVRWVLRQPGGEILNSTYFSVLGPADAQGGVRLEGRGYGHGIGMCQWGAIGRARAGQDFRTILRTYFPGTILGAVG